MRQLNIKFKNVTDEGLKEAVEWISGSTCSKTHWRERKKMTLCSRALPPDNVNILGDKPEKVNCVACIRGMRRRNII